jgi:hypothetical protein
VTAGCRRFDVAYADIRGRLSQRCTLVDVPSKLAVDAVDVRVVCVVIVSGDDDVHLVDARYSILTA